MSIVARIRLYKESGILDHWVKWEKPKFQCLGFGPVSASSPATMRHFNGSFALIAVGVCVASLTLLGEIMFYR